MDQVLQHSVTDWPLPSEGSNQGRLWEVWLSQVTRNCGNGTSLMDLIQLSSYEGLIHICFGKKNMDKTEPVYYSIKYNYWSVESVSSSAAWCPLPTRKSVSGKFCSTFWKTLSCSLSVVRSPQLKVCTVLQVFSRVAQFSNCFGLWKLIKYKSTISLYKFDWLMQLKLLINIRVHKIIP